MKVEGKRMKKDTVVAVSFFDTQRPKCVIIMDFEAGLVQVQID